MKEAAETSESSPPIALLRLARGVSTHETWVLGNRKGPATVTIGADASCDWQVHGPDVPKHALSIALIDGELFIASGDEEPAFVEGSPLPEAWQKVDRNLRIALGSAEIELVWERRAWDADDARSERDRVTFTDGIETDVRTRPRTQGARSSWVERFSRSPLMDTPTLLGRVAETRSSSPMLRYAALALFTALAYRAWLVLLDRF